MRTVEEGGGKKGEKEGVGEEDGGTEDGGRD
jgi:hypothetical protein